MASSNLATYRNHKKQIHATSKEKKMDFGTFLESTPPILNENEEASVYNPTKIQKGVAGSNFGSAFSSKSLIQNGFLML
jgi:hypothetical protein